MGKQVQVVFTDSLDGKTYPREELKRFELTVREGGVTQRWALYLTDENRKKFRSAVKEWTKNEKVNDPEEEFNPEGFQKVLPEKRPAPKKQGVDGLAANERDAVRRWEHMTDRRPNLRSKGRIPAKLLEEWAAEDKPLPEYSEYMEYLAGKEAKDPESA